MQNQTSNFDMKMKLIHGFSNKTRIQILECIKEEEKTVNQIVEEIKGSQSNISQHLACLKGCGIIVGRNEGRYMYYSLRNQHIRDLLSMFDVVLEDVENDVACCDRHID
ncbi:ArsR/SmtB family transcription factor [Ureibacillus chungkukjangi]|uniref:ArsR family transcriptional regulator n=1 Tax=Ureibacillus chungkukjangi TaxID=1202712 RepID=A0A318TUP9_9BACL|nr:metalloregulator ArsR/SmtB family transcription factor [Ureibacillus chungkukjangi]MCM3388310.1 metalloregulator ArsR/SmtB family transcription factor [Ureibacillus chungkukjangi]PYF08394.1 ArsR family transcriptional regulator [Ureibacillus chungkukjangi]